MALSFPTSPSPGDVYAAPNGVNYTWDNGAGVWTATGSTPAWTVSGSNVFPTVATTLQFNSGYGSNATAYGCRAWVNFDGVPASPTIRAGGNVSSVTKNGTGSFVVNFTVALVDTNYAALISQSRDGGGNPPTPVSTQDFAGTPSSVKTTTQCAFGTGGNVSAYDATQISVAIIR